MAVLGDVVRSARTERGWTQDDLAERARVSRKHISSIERGAADVSVSVLQKVASALGLSSVPLDGLAIRTADDSSSLTQVDAYLSNAIRDLAAARSLLGGGRLAPVIPIRTEIRDAPTSTADLPTAKSYRLRITLDEQNLLDELREAFQNSPDAEYRTPFRGKKKYTVPRGIDVAAGHGAELLEPDEEVPREIPEHYHDLGARMVLRARGNSLIGRGIVDRDLLFVKPTPTPENDRIIVCRLNDHAFVKIFRRIDDKHAELLSANPDFGPIPIGPADSFHCFGVVVGRSGYALQQTEEVK